MSFVKGFEDGCEDSRVFSTRCTDCYSITGGEEGCGGNSVVDFVFEDGNETGFAEFLIILWSNYQGASSLANGTKSGCHFEDNEWSRVAVLSSANSSSHRQNISKWDASKPSKHGQHVMISLSERAKIFGASQSHISRNRNLFSVNFNDDANHRQSLHHPPSESDKMARF